MAHLLMLHGHPVGYLPPTMASEILYDSNNTVEDKIDEIITQDSYLITPAFTPPYTNKYILKKQGKIVCLIIDGVWIDSITADTVKIVGTIPTSLIPSVNITSTTALIEPMGGNVIGYGRMYINQNGQLCVKSSASINSSFSIQGTLTWLIS